MVGCAHMRFFWLFFAFAVAAPAQTYRDWRVVGGAKNIHYAALDQIKRTNVEYLKVAGQVDSHDEYGGSEQQRNPIIIDGVLYATTRRYAATPCAADPG